MSGKAGMPVPITFTMRYVKPGALEAPYHMLTYPAVRAAALKNVEESSLSLLEELRPFHQGLLDIYAKEQVSDKQDQETYTAPRLIDRLQFANWDATILYGMVRRNQPKHVIELGQGNSTCLIRQAITDGKFPCDLTVLDPFPDPGIGPVLADNMELSWIEDLPIERFQELGAGDILFIDAPHYVLPATAVPAILLNIIPALQEGVWVHLHDIFIGVDVPPRVRQHNYMESYIVMAMLQYGLSGGWFNSVHSNYLLRAVNIFPDSAKDIDVELAEKAAAAYQLPFTLPLKQHGFSLWLQRGATQA